MTYPQCPLIDILISFINALPYCNGCSQLRNSHCELFDLKLVLHSQIHAMATPVVNECTHAANQKKVIMKVICSYHFVLQVQNNSKTWTVLWQYCRLYRHTRKLEATSSTDTMRTFTDTWVPNIWFYFANIVRVLRTFKGILQFIHS